MAAALAGSPLPAVLSPTVTPVVVPCEKLRPATPWRGPLFDLFEELVAAADAPAATSAAAAAPDAPAAPAAGTVGVLVPMRWVDAAPAPELIIVADHVNTRLRGPLTGRRPTSGPHSSGPQPSPR